MASARTAPLDVIPDVTSRIAVRVTELKGARQTYLEQAQRQMAAFDAAIGELEAMLKPPAPPAEASAEASPNGAEMSAQAEMVLVP